MRKFVCWFFGIPSHQHFWEIIHRWKIIDTTSQQKIATRYAMQCKHCGEVKFKQSNEVDY